MYLILDNLFSYFESAAKIAWIFDFYYKSAPNKKFSGYIYTVALMNNTLYSVLHMYLLQ